MHTKVQRNVIGLREITGIMGLAGGYVWVLYVCALRCRPLLVLLPNPINEMLMILQ